MLKRDEVLDISLEDYKVDAKDHVYVEKLSQVESTDAKQFLDVGVDTGENDRIYTQTLKPKLKFGILKGRIPSFDDNMVILCWLQFIDDCCVPSSSHT